MHLVAVPTQTTFLCTRDFPATQISDASPLLVIWVCPPSACVLLHKPTLQQDEVYLHFGVLPGHTLWVRGALWTTQRRRVISWVSGASKAKLGIVNTMNIMFWFQWLHMRGLVLSSKGQSSAQMRNVFQKVAFQKGLLSAPLRPVLEGRDRNTLNNERSSSPDSKENSYSLINTF